MIKPSSGQNFETFSVVIPYFNSSKTIDRAVESVLAQSIRPLEVIIVDDCSSPSEKQYLKEVSHSDSSIRVIWHDRNMGPASARNTGWNEAKSTWVAFLDSDDSWHPQKLEMQHLLLDTLGTKPVLIGSETQIITEEFKPVSFDLDDTVSYKNISLWSLLFRNQFATSTVILKQNLEVRFSPGRKFSEDYELWLQIASSEESLTKVSLPLAYYYKPFFGESGLSSNLFGMALGELQTYLRLFRSKRIGFFQLISASMFSAVKSARRFLVVLIRRALQFSR